MNVRFNKHEGFTLVEVLLGLAIFSTIIVCVYSVFWGGIKINYRAEEQNMVYREARWAFDLMSKDLESMVPYDFSKSYSDKNAFVGNSDKIMFIKAEADGLKVISYSLVEPEQLDVYSVIVGDLSLGNVGIQTGDISEEKAYYLVREETSFAVFLSGNQSDNKEQEILSANVRSDGLKFFYGYLDGENSQDISWEEEWKNDYIPSNVRIEIDFIKSKKKQEILSLYRDILIPAGFWGQKEEG